MRDRQHSQNAAASPQPGETLVHVLVASTMPLVLFTLAYLIWGL